MIWYLDYSDGTSLVEFIEKEIFPQSNGDHLEKWQPFLMLKVANNVSGIEIQYV